jgi:hypothetical protein
MDIVLTQVTLLLAGPCQKFICRIEVFGGGFYSVAVACRMQAALSSR